MGKRAFLLSMDAFIAVGLLLLLTAFLSSMSVSYSSPEIEYQRFYYVGKDVINSLEKAKLTAVIEFMPENFTVDCNISDADMDKTILDALGFLWAQNSTILNDCAKNLTKEVLNRTLPENYGYEVLIDGISIHKEGTVGSYLSRLHTIVSGYELGKPVSGYFASAYISRMAKETFSYFYFGGYVGDGNITKNMVLPSDANVTYAYLEANVGSNFTLYMNGNLVGQFNSTSTNLTATNWTLCYDYADCQGFFQAGNNTMTLNFSNFVNNFVGGGFLKVFYNTSKPDTRGIFSVSNDTELNNYWFPGIVGIINIYSGFYVPGTLNNLSLRIHYDNNITINDSGVPVFFIIGDNEIFRSNVSGDIVVDMNDSVLRSKLNYDAISNSTVPLRLGMETFFVLSGVGSSDVVLITDRSGSMGTCDVWSNSSFDCLPGACNDRCSASCDDDNSTCENVCGGTWTEVTPGVYSCVGATSQCCDSQALCTQCGGLWGRRDRINVAKDSDIEFIDAVLGFQGNKAGLTGYGTNVCSYEEATLNQTLLENKVSTYGDDCSGTCICCGINKALDIIQKGKDFNTIFNSKFTGPSIDGWNESGVVNLSADVSGIDTMEFEGPDSVLDPDIIHVSSNIFAIAYERSSDDNGWITTVQIDSNGSITGPIDDYEFDNDKGENPDIIHVANDVFAVVYRGNGNEGWAMTVDIAGDGNIGSEIDKFGFMNSEIYNPDIIHVSGDVYAVAYRMDSGDEGFLSTFDIDSSGNIGAGIDSYEFDDSNCIRPDIIHVSGDIYAIAFTGPGTDGWVRTVDIASDGNIGSVQDSFEFETGNTYEPVIEHVSGDVYAVAYRRDSDDDGWLKTIEIETDGTIAQTFIDWLEFDGSNTYTPDMVKIYGDYYAIAYRGPGSDGFVKVVEISEDGNINWDIVDSIEFQTGNIYTPSIVNASDEVFAIAYRLDSDDDGYVSTVRMGHNLYGLYDFWYVSSDHTSYGALTQNFTLPTGEIINANPTLYHSTSDSFFDGTADVYCNLTYPNASGPGSLVATIWADSWNSGNNPVGPVMEDINITEYMTVKQFVYTLECGADVTSGGGSTVVAFDNIMHNITMDRYKAMLVMSDGAATIYCDSFSDFMGSGSGGTSDAIDREWAVNSSCNARDNGIDIFTVAFGTGADPVTMQKIACWNCTANDWIPGQEEDNCSRYYQSNNAEELIEVYKEIAESMGKASYEAQTVNISGDVSLMNTLFPDSYLRFNYTPKNILGFGEVSIALESDRFGGNVTSPKYGDFYVPSNSEVLDAKVTSYSSEYWTSLVEMNSTISGGWQLIYNISAYGDDFVEIGDPFTIHLPVNLIQTGDDNFVSINTGLAPDYFAGGSPDDRAMFYVSVSGIVGYGNVYPTMGNATADAIQRLQNQLSDFNITLLDVETPTQYVGELPSLWGPSIMEVRIWT